MTVQLNHTIVAAHDKQTSARFLADILGLRVSPQYGPFIPVEIPNGVTLDYVDTARRHHAPALRVPRLRGATSTRSSPASRRRA